MLCISAMIKANDMLCCTVVIVLMPEDGGDEALKIADGLMALSLNRLDFPKLTLSLKWYTLRMYLAWRLDQC